MHQIFEKHPSHIRLWPIPISKIIGAWVAISILFALIGPAILVLMSSSVTGLFVTLLLMLVIEGVPMYMVVKDYPMHWRSNMRIDFENEKIIKKYSVFTFSEIDSIEAKQYESFIFPTFCKISIETKMKRAYNLIALKLVSEYG